MTHRLRNDVALVTASILFLLAACSAAPPADDGGERGTAAPGLTVAKVTARGETAPVATADDAADDPAIWRNPADPPASLVIGTDKKAGIHVYGLDGARRSFTPSPRLNNVDLRDGVTVAGKRAVLVAASDRRDEAHAQISLFTLDTARARLVPLVRLPVGPGEAYGMCLWRRHADGALFGFVVMKDGRIDQLAIDASGRTVTATRLRSMKLASQSEGCVADDRTGQLYVAEEDVGIWRFAADPAASAEPLSVAKVDSQALFADVEGLALAPVGADGGYLVASSQGDNAYALYRLPGLAYAGRFRIAAGQLGAVSETDGIEVVPGDFGQDWPGGLFVVQDGDNAPAAQNFKLVAWDDVVKAAGLHAAPAR
jgi:3-phytase